MQKNLSHRIERLLLFSQKNDLEGFLVLDPTNLFYYTNLSLSTGALLVSKDKKLLFVDSRYREAAEELYSTSALSELESYLSKSSIKTLGIDGDTLSHTDYLNFSKEINIQSFSGALSSLRAIKDKEEIALIKKSCSIASMGMSYGMQQLKQGMTERELFLKIDRYLKDNGADQLSFDMIVAFGKNSSKPHYHTSDCKLQDGDIVLIDLGVVYKNYCSDMTRTFFFNKGSFELEELKKEVERIKKEVISQIKPQITTKYLDEFSHKLLEKIEGYEKKHSLGHGIGLNVHEFPSFKKEVVLESSMVITIEPGVYLPNVGGVRIEDTILVTDQSFEILT